MKNIGLVFSGGGGKGPYQLGVWRYLRETGIEKRIGVVSGTSIGALNAALFVSGELDTVENLWRNISPSDILTPKKITAKNISSWFSVGIGALTLAVAPLIDPLGLTGAAGLMGLSHSATTLFASQGSVFTQDGMKYQIDNGLEYEKLIAADIPCYATCLNIGIPKHKPYAQRFDLRRFPEEDVKKILMASAAIPGVYEPVEFGGEKYCDGGFTSFGDNVPVKPAYDEGMDKILVIHLSSDEPTDASIYPDSEIIDILPSVDLGGMLNGTMDFSAKGAVRRMEIGYNDAKNILEPLLSKLL